MNKEDLINKIKKETSKYTGTKSEIQKKRALKIYLELGIQKTFDEKYYFGNSSTQKQIYALAQKEKIEDNEDKRKIICMSLARQYNQILKEFNIKAMLSPREENDQHVYSIVELEDKTKFKADLQRDLYKIHSGSMIEHFGKNIQNNGRQLIRSELINMLIENGYISKEKELKEFEIERIKKITKKLKYSDKLDIILTDKKIYKNSPKIGYIETKTYYEELLRYIMPEEINKKVMTFDCYKQKEEEKKYTMCIYLKDKGEIKLYIYSEKEEKFLKTNIAKLIELEKEGLILGGTSQKKGNVKKIKKEISEYNKKNQKEYEF